LTPTVSREHKAKIHKLKTADGHHLENLVPAISQRHIFQLTGNLERLYATVQDYRTVRLE